MAITAEQRKLRQIYEEFTPGSIGFCRAVETHCGYGISRDEIRRIASRASDEEEFAGVWENEDWWKDQ